MNFGKKTYKRAIASLVALVMVMAMLPVTSFAAAGDVAIAHVMKNATNQMVRFELQALSNEVIATPGGPLVTAYNACTKPPVAIIYKNATTSAEKYEDYATVQAAYVASRSQGAQAAGLAASNVDKKPEAFAAAGQTVYPVTATGTADTAAAITVTGTTPSKVELKGVTVAGTPAVGQTLTATLDPVSASATYKWFAVDTMVTTGGVQIAGEVTDKLVLKAAQKDKFVYVVASPVAATTSGTDKMAVTTAKVTEATTKVTMGTALTFVDATHATVTFPSAVTGLTKDDFAVTGNTITAIEAVTGTNNCKLTFGTAVVSGASATVTAATTSTKIMGTATGSYMATATGATISSIAVDTSTVIKVATTDTTGLIINAEDFTVTVDTANITAGSGAGKFSVTSVTAKEATITLGTAIGNGKAVVVTGKGDLGGTATASYYQAGLKADSGVVTANDEASTLISTPNTANAEGAVVTAKDADTAAVKATTTVDSAGKFNLRLPAGDYRIEIAKEGYQTYKISKTIATTDSALAEIAGGGILLKSTSTAIMSSSLATAAIDGDTVKVISGTSGTVLANALKLKIGTTSGNVVVQTTATDTTAVTSATVSATNKVVVTAEDATTKKTYNVAITTSTELGVLGVEVTKGTNGGTVKLINTASGMRYKINNDATAYAIGSSSVDNITAKVGDVILVWTGEDPTAAGMFKSITIKATDIKSATAPIIGGSQVVKQGGNLNLTPIVDMTGYKLQVSKDGTTFVDVASYTTGASTVKLPATLAAASTYKLYMAHVTSGAISDGSSATFTVDNTAPVVTAGASSRTTATAATVKITSNKAGTPYVIVLASSSAAPTPDIVLSAGTAKAAVNANVESTISLTLTDKEAYTAYVVVKDAAGNFNTTAASFAFAEMIAGVPYNANPYVIEAVGDSSLSNNGIALQTNGNILYKVVSAEGTAFPGSNNYDAIKALIQTGALQTGDSITLDSAGKISAIAVISSGISNASLTANAVADPLTLTGHASTTLKVSGNLADKNVSAPTKDALYDFGALVMQPSVVGGKTKGTITFGTDHDAASIPANVGLRFVTNAANAVKVNNVLITPGAGNAFVVTSNGFDFEGKGTTLNIDASAGAITVAKTIGIVNSAYQTGKITLKGNATVETALTTDGATTADVDLKGGLVDVTGYQGNGAIAADGTAATTVTAGTNPITANGGTTAATNDVTIKSAGAVTLLASGTAGIVQIDGTVASITAGDVAALAKAKSGAVITGNVTVGAITNLVDLSLATVGGTVTVSKNVGISPGELRLNPSTRVIQFNAAARNVAAAITGGGSSLTTADSNGITATVDATGVVTLTGTPSGTPSTFSIGATTTPYGLITITSSGAAITVISITVGANA